MLTASHLCLRLNRLRAAEMWVNEGEGLLFVFPKAGRGAVVLGSNTQELAPGDALVLNRAAEGRLGPVHGEEMVFWNFWAQLEHFFPLFAADEISLLHGVEEEFRRGRLYTALTPVAAKCHRLVAAAPPQVNLDHRSHVLQIAAAVFSAELSQARPARSGFVRMDEHLRSVFETLSVDDILDRSVTELALRFGCSRRHLNRLFHQYFGCSVAALRMEMRLLKAAALFRDPSVKVIHVAEQCGFNHLGLFNTCFKRRFGVSPGRWRKQPAAVNRQPQELISTDAQCRLRGNGLCPWFGQAAPGKSMPGGPCWKPRSALENAQAADRRNATGRREGESPGLTLASSAGGGLIPTSS